MRSANDNDNQLILESEWASAAIVLGLPLAIAVVAFGCTFFI
jgi:hypothetical protein